MWLILNQLVPQPLKGCQGMHAISCNPTHSMDPTLHLIIYLKQFVHLFYRCTCLCGHTWATKRVHRPNGPAPGCGLRRDGSTRCRPARSLHPKRCRWCPPCYSGSPSLSFHENRSRGSLYSHSDPVIEMEDAPELLLLGSVRSWRSLASWRPESLTPDIERSTREYCGYMLHVYECNNSILHPISIASISHDDDRSAKGKICCISYLLHPDRPHVI